MRIECTQEYAHKWHVLTVIDYMQSVLKNLFSLFLIRRNMETHISQDTKTARWVSRDPWKFSRMWKTNMMKYGKYQLLYYIIIPLLCAHYYLLLSNIYCCIDEGYFPYNTPALDNRKYWCKCNIFSSRYFT